MKIYNISFCYRAKSLPTIIYTSKCLLFCSVLFLSCKKFVEVPPPVSNTNADNVYSNDASATAVLTGIYAKLSNTSIFNSIGVTTISAYLGLSADELTLHSSSNSEMQKGYYKNSLSTAIGGFEQWNNLYSYIFVCNSAIEGVTKSNELSIHVKKQLLGEAKFLRGFFYFYLVNLYGEVPLVVSTDYQTNASLSRSSVADIYHLIIEDLNEAKDLLSVNYLDGSLMKISIERVRPTKWASAALLSRVYLFLADWAKAEQEASSIINQSVIYDTVSLNTVFLKNSKETIWQLQPVRSGSNTEDAKIFILPTSGPSASFPLYINDDLVQHFENNDNRKYSWTKFVTVSGVNYYYPYKYKINSPNVAVNEYLMVFRLGEQYLIRAEARGQQNNFSGALSDLNLIRKRAGLAGITISDKASLINAVIKERRSELFTEWGHRWFDLKRNGLIDATMTMISAQKGAIWASYKQLFPIPITDILSNPNLIQNTGY